MRVLAGIYKSKKIETINNADTRPMMSKVREAIFNSIQFMVEEKDVLDLYSGSGSLGIEALSRGANYVTFVDSSISGPFVELILATYGFSAALISGSAAHVADTISVSGDIETEFLVDAYGTMQLPMGSYDCLRLKIERNSTTNIQVHCIDTISGSGTGWYQIPFSDFEEDISYQWWTNNPDSRFFLAEAYVDSSDNVLAVSYTHLTLPTSDLV